MLDTYHRTRHDIFFGQHYWMSMFGLPQMVDGQLTLVVRVDVSEQTYAYLLKAPYLELAPLPRRKTDVPVADRVAHAA